MRTVHNETNTTDESKIKGKENLSKVFCCTRTLAIITVISAHINIKVSLLISNLYGIIGSIGVIVFFLISGYYFKKEKPLVLLKKKVKSIILPWVLLGSVVYVINSILNDFNFDIIAYIQWMFGYKTYLYYVVVILVCFIIFYFNNLATLIAAIVLNALSITFTSIGVLNSVIERIGLTNYLNIFNWVGFFALGILLKRINSDKLYSFIKRSRWFFIILSCTLTVIFTCTGYKLGYFSALGWLYELISAFSIFGLCTFKFLQNKFIIDISESSYAIYLLHMAFVGIYAKVYGLHFSISLIANIIVLLVVFGLIVLGKMIAKIIKLENVYNICLGLRKVKR